jgi:hypothetical protein
MLGRPEKPEDYKVPEIENADMSGAEAFRQMAHEAGLNKQQFEHLVTKFTQAQLAQSQQVMQNLEKDQANLKTEWGADYDRRQGMAAKFMELTEAPENLRNLYKENKVPMELSKWVFNMADKMMGESGINLATDVNDRAKGQPTPHEAAEKINDIRQNKDHPYFNKSHPGHADAVALMRKLYKLKAAANG